MPETKRIVYIANTRLRYTNILKSILMSLIEMGFYIREYDPVQHRDFTHNPRGLMGGHGPVEVNYEKISQDITNFKPDIIIFAGGGLTFSEEVSAYLKNKGVILLGITLSDPDVFPTTKNYIDRFTYHTTNSKKALEMYSELGFNNTFYLPFGIDSRFFVPVNSVKRYKADVVIMSHFRESRLHLAEQLRQRYNTKIFGSGWPYHDVEPIEYPEWLKAIHSSKIVIDFPQTGAGYKNIKVRIFEVAATGKMLITRKTDLLDEFFDVNKEIVVYDSVEELFIKIDYYLSHPEERKKIAERARLKCAEKHQWKDRFQELFNQFGLTLL